MYTSRAISLTLVCSILTLSMDAITQTTLALTRQTVYIQQREGIIPIKVVRGYSLTLNFAPLGETPRLVRLDGQEGFTYEHEGQIITIRPHVPRKQEGVYSAENGNKALLTVTTQEKNTFQIVITATDDTSQPSLVDFEYDNSPPLLIADDSATVELTVPPPLPERPIPPIDTTTSEQTAQIPLPETESLDTTEPGVALETAVTEHSAESDSQQRTIDKQLKELKARLKQIEEDRERQQLEQRQREQKQKKQQELLKKRRDKEQRLATKIKRREQKKAQKELKLQHKRQEKEEKQLAKQKKRLQELQQKVAKVEEKSINESQAQQTSQPDEQQPMTMGQDGKTINIKQLSTYQLAHALREGANYAKGLPKPEIRYSRRRYSNWAKVQAIIKMLNRGVPWDWAVQRAKLNPSYARDLLDYGLQRTRITTIQ